MLSGCVFVSGGGGVAIRCSRSFLKLFYKTKWSRQTFIEKYSAVRRKFINWHQLMWALFISGEHEKWSKEVWNCRRAGWLHSGSESLVRFILVQGCFGWGGGEKEGHEGRREVGRGRVQAPSFWTVELSSDSCASLTRGRQQYWERGCLGQMDLPGATSPLTSHDSFSY